MKCSRVMAVACASAALLAAGCGSDDKGGSAGNATAASADTTTAATAASSAPAPATTPPEATPVSEPLSKTPPKGKKVIFLQCELPACQRFVGGMKGATAALGWDVKVEVFKNANPGAGLQQAINEKPDFIAMSGIPVAAMKPQFAAAKKAGIPIVSCSTTDQPSADGYASQCNGSLEPDASEVGKWIIKDSGGKADVVGVSIPQFPVLNTETDWFKGDFKKLCPGCSYDSLDVTVDDIGQGAVASKLVAYLQGHPSVGYVFDTFNDLTLGVPAALKAAGMADKVKLTGAAGDQGIMKAIGGEQAAWTIAPNEYFSWLMVDAMARLSVGDTLSPEYQKQVYAPDAWVVDSKESADLLKPYGYDWPGPGYPNGTGYKDTFAKLWQLG